MKFLIILALIGFAAAVPDSEESSENEIESGKTKEIEWYRSFWNIFQDDDDVRGPHMRCIEDKAYVLFKEAKPKLIALKDWRGEWIKEVKQAKPEERVAKFKKGIKEFKKFLELILGVYDDAVPLCRDDDNFKLVDFVHKFLDLFVDFDHDALNTILNELGGEIMEAEKGNVSAKLRQQAECYEESLSKLGECAKTSLNLKVYEEKGFCGINHMQFLNCFEDFGRKCSEDLKSEITVIGSVLFRLVYEACHH